MNEIIECHKSVMVFSSNRAKRIRTNQTVDQLRG
jgi:hypothetical protein